MNRLWLWLLLALALWVTFKAALALLRMWLRGPAGSREHYEQVERAAMPREIAEGTLVLNEKTLWRRGRRPIAAKTDQVFRTPEGWLVPVETKARRRVSDSDVVQLSCQAAALAYTREVSGKPAGWGYVRLAPPGQRPRYERVTLLGEDKLDLLWDRWDALRRGQAAPIVRPAPYRCPHCQLRSRCPDAVANLPRKRRS